MINPSEAIRHEWTTNESRNELLTSTFQLETRQEVDAEAISEESSFLRSKCERTAADFLLREVENVGLTEALKLVNTLLARPDYLSGGGTAVLIYLRDFLTRRLEIPCRENPSANKTS